ERILGDDEFPKFWQAFGTLDVIRGSALKVLLLTGQRPGEVAHMRHDHISNGWWTMPGAPDADWPGTKSGREHRVWLAQPARDIISMMKEIDTMVSISSSPLTAGARSAILTGRCVRYARR